MMGFGIFPDGARTRRSMNEMVGFTIRGAPTSQQEAISNGKCRFYRSGLVGSGRVASSF